MKVSRHRDGTYTITGMSREDLSKLTFGASSASAYYASNNPHWSQTESDKAWMRSQAPLYDRLYDALHVVTEARSAGSVTLDESYNLRGRQGLEPWSAA